MADDLVADGFADRLGFLERKYVEARKAIIEHDGSGWPSSPIYVEVQAWGLAITDWKKRG